MRIAIIADTHMPRGSRRLPARCVEEIAAADALIHAGDLIASEVLAELRGLCPVVHAVHGNVDVPELRRALPETLELEAAGHRLAVIHDAGPARGRAARMRARFPDAEAVIFGHSHLPLDEERDGVRLFNPGSPTERRRAPRRSMGLLEASAQRLGLRHVWLEAA
jgi:putative phosphoesterase